MGSHAYASPSPFFVSSFNTSNSKLPLKTNIISFPSFNPPKNCHLKLPSLKTNATLDEKDPSPLLVQEQQQSDSEVEESVKVLKKAAKTRKVSGEEVLSALSVIEKANLDPSGKQLKGGRYFPLTAVQRFDAADIKSEFAFLEHVQGLIMVSIEKERGLRMGCISAPLGCLTFEGRFSWKKRILAFIFECIRIKIGNLKPLEISLGQKNDREPGNKDPFFIWFYIDEEIAVARGRSGGTAFWCRCHRVNTSYSF
ncbi:hypothetical protein Pint_16963 [Pistacia integerrima]|uniref:Uncharacterized protein n=1 Tax=Pistacia integerrima TaxID=434235 RepID=A0ACC0ZFJ5_9ROSI|nr:hypothetical protein Pint_16963 [Pistacia integerrima]